jgi:hypothetical protein
MSEAEIAKEIVIAMIQSGKLSGYEGTAKESFTDNVSESYKAICKAVAKGIREMNS